MPKITPSSFDKHTEPVVEQYRELETAIFVMIAERLKTNGDYAQDEVLQWQIDKLNQMDLINRDTIKLLSEMTSKTQREIEQAIVEVASLTLETVDEIGRAHV